MTIRRFRTRLLAVIIGLLALAQLVTTVAVLTTTGSNLRGQARDGLELGGRVFAELLTSREQELLTTTRILTSDFGFREAVATGDAATIRSALRNHGNRIDADAAMALELDGSLITTLDDTLAEARFPFRGLLEQAREDGYATGVVTLAGRPVQLVIVPVLAPLPVAWTALGFELDAVLADELKQLTGLEVTFHAAGTSRDHMGSTLPERLHTHMADGLTELPSGQATVVSLGSERWFTLRLPLSRADNTVTAYLQAAENSVLTPYHQLRSQLLWMATALLLASVVAGSFMARQVSQPVMALARAAARIARGQYDTPVPRPSSDEFGDLADTFNRMQDGIAEREQRIQHQADHDGLTGLPNRRAAHSLLDSMAADIDSPFTVLLIDLNRFREVNDSLGYGIGDQLLRAMARRLAAATPTAIAARTGGNEFLLLLPDWTAETLASRADALLDALTTPVALADLRIPVSLRAGAVCHPDATGTADTLLRRAEIARERARHARTHLGVYEAGEDEAYLRRLRLVSHMPDAIAKGDLTLVYQPQLRLSDDQVVGVEALARWQHPELGFVPPDEFIPLAEQSGHIQALTRHVLTLAMAECRRLRDAGHDLHMSINLSARDLLEPDLQHWVSDGLARHGIDAGRITLEITETLLMEDPVQAGKQLSGLRALGVRLAIDDFGTGYSSLAQLKHMPVHELKVDRSFVMGLPGDEADEAIVRMTVQMAHALGLCVVAEGMENPAAGALLAALQCEYAQGYGIARPLSAEALHAWLDNQHRGAARGGQRRSTF